MLTDSHSSLLHGNWRENKLRKQETTEPEKFQNPKKTVLVVIHSGNFPDSIESVSWTSVG